MANKNGKFKTKSGDVLYPHTLLACIDNLTTDLPSYAVTSIGSRKGAITIANLKSDIGNATTSAAGLMSSTDKTRLNNIYTALNGTDSSKIDTIAEVYSFLEDYAQTTDLATLLADKVGSDIVETSGNNTIIHPNNYANGGKVYIESDAPANKIITQTDLDNKTFGTTKIQNDNDTPTGYLQFLAAPGILYSAMGDLKFHLDSTTISGPGGTASQGVSAVNLYFNIPRNDVLNSGATAFTFATREWVNNKGYLTAPTAVNYSYNNMESATLYKDGIVVTGNFPVFPSQSGGSLYKFPLDEGASEFTFATREWVNAHALSVDNSGEINVDIGDTSESYGYYHSKLSIYTSYAGLYIGATDSSSYLILKDSKGEKLAIRFKHHIQMANSSIKCKFSFTNDVKTAYTSYNALAYAIYSHYRGSSYMRTNSHSIEASGYDLGSSPSRFVYCVYATGTTTIKVGESNGSDYTMSSNSFSIIDDVEVV